MNEFRQNLKTPILGPFWPLFSQKRGNRIFSKIRALSLLYIYGSLTSCKKSEKYHEPILRKSVTYWLTDLLTDWPGQFHRSHPLCGGPIRKYFYLIPKIHWPCQCTHNSYHPYMLEVSYIIFSFNMTLKKQPKIDSTPSQKPTS